MNPVLAASVASQPLNQVPPVARPHRDRQEAIEEHEMNLLNIRTMESSIVRNHLTHTKTTVITGQSHSSTKSLSEPKPIHLSQMAVPRVHEGAYLVCRTLMQACVTVATCSLVEDLREDVESIFLYNFRLDLTDSKWLSPGTIMVIKEPYLKYGTSLQGQIMLRVDSLSDVIFVDASDEAMLRNVGALKWFQKQVLTSQQLKEKGNEFYGKHQFEEAIKWYGKAILASPNLGVLHLNMAAALLTLERYCEAYQEAKKALSLGADKAKSLLRLGRAAYGMRNWQLAVEHLQDFSHYFPDKQEALLDIEKVTKRLRESQTGSYDLHYLAKEAIDNKIFLMDLADYTGPVVIDDIAGKGKGIVATEDVTKGTLLMVSKAFSISRNNDLPDINFEAFNLITNNPSRKTQNLDIIKTMHMLLHNPHRAQDFYSLYAGDLSREDYIPTGVVDAQRVEKICTFNSFGVQTLFCVPNEEGSEIPCGLWILPSFLNHSCVANSFRVYCGDTMFVYAIRHVKKGEEITIGYMDCFQPYTERVKKMEDYGFKCTCELCTFDKTNPSNNTREELWRQAEAIGNNLLLQTPQAARQLDSLIEQIHGSEINGKKFNTLQFHPLTSLYYMHRNLGNMEKCLEVLKQMMACCGELYIHIHGVQICIWKAECYLELGNPEAARANARLALTINQIRMGGDEQLFKKVYPDARRFF